MEVKKNKNKKEIFLNKFLIFFFFFYNINFNKN
jgi:hypothetical protein